MILDPAEWRARAEAHAARVDVWVQPHLARRHRGEAHPVHDFLFTYYSQRPAGLLRWHPGYGVTLADAPEYDGLKGYAGSTVSPDYLAAQLPLVRGLHTLLSATASRPPTLGCFGLHEWAMAYRSAQSDPAEGSELRHAWPLRLGGSGTDEVVEGHRIGCSHFDAYRFFTPPARPLNTLQPGRDDRPAFEQPGCLHAGMDLYKHAFRLSPLIPSELVADAFALAWDIRILDMRAAPYDFTGVTLDPTGEPWTPVAIETPEGKSEYVAAQRGFSERGAPIRTRLVEECARLLRASTA
ncbi:hypothetical protein ABIE44_000511 [Marmoricola sp. OAE513]|uniref:3-methyladenine DNA glycosylase n=1 Tax=Marmoricola sp. OAE513 TaxID=2817894 RepID=UPI001AE2997F